MANQFKFDLFISYCHQNKNAVSNIYDKLKQVGVKSWIDIKEMICELHNGINESELFLCCASTDYCNSEKCLRELRYADFLKKKIIFFVLFEHFHSKEEKNEKLKAINWYLLDHKYYRYDRIDDLINAITILLKVIKILH